MDENIEIKQTCAFCGRESDTRTGRILIQGIAPYVYICTDCAADCANVAKEYKVDHAVSQLLQNGFKPSNVKKHLDQYIIDQEYAKTVLSVAVYNHYKFLEYKQQENPPVEIEKSNIMIVGPTGCGKTALARHLAKVLDVPFAMADATNLTAAGYTGEDVENVIRLLVENANWDIEKAQRGIVYIDEIDKLSRKGENVSITRDVGGEGVQQALLKIIEGAVIEITQKGQRKHPGVPTTKIDTSNILFIVGGSFEGIEKIIGKRLRSNKANMGFGNELNTDSEKSFNDFILSIKVEDLKKFGILPELLGRLPILCPLQELTKDALLRILTEPKNALIKQYQALMNFENIELEFTKEALEAVADKALARKTGARALRSILEEALLNHMYKIPEMANVEKVTVTRECITENSEPTYIYRESILNLEEENTNGNHH